VKVKPIEKEEQNSTGAAEGEGKTLREEGANP